MKIKRSKLHRYIGLVLLPFLVVSALTGFFRANHKWFWKEDYKKVKNTRYSYTLDVPAVSMDSLFRIVRDEAGVDAAITEIRFRKEAGRLFYDVRLRGHHPLLIDAANGKVLSPITAELAVTLASQYVKDNPEMKSIVLNEHYRTRKEHKLRQVYVVSYKDALNTQILLDKYNGEIEEEIDNNLKFGFWMVKLHDYDFWNSKRAILSFAGLGLTAVALTGFYLWIKVRRKKKKVSIGSEV